jgi:hypothetical protein
MYVKATNGSVDQYPYTVAQLRRDNPNTSFPKRIPEATLASWNVYPVIKNDAPSYTERTQKIERESTPTLSDDSWSIGWTVTNKTAEEIQEYDDDVARSNRAKRNNLLSETDIYGLSDMTMTTEMTTYRQALRDITDHDNWPNLSDSDWPTKP